MPSYLDFPAAALAQMGSSIFKGLLQGRQIHAEEEDRRLKQEHQTFLDRIAAERLRLEQGREQREQGAASEPVYHGGYALNRRTGQPLFPLPTPLETPAQRAQREASEATTQWRQSQILGIGQPKTLIERIEKKIEGAEHGLKSLSPGELAVWNAHHPTPKAPASEHERMTTLWLEMNRLSDTPENRLKSPYRIESAEERREARAHDLNLRDMRGPWIDARQPGVSVADNITHGEWKEAGGNKSYRRIQPLQQQTAQLIVSQGFPNIDNMKRLAPIVLAKAKGENLIRWVENRGFQAMLSDAAVREFAQSATIVAYEISRAMGGSTALRQFVSVMLLATEVPNFRDRQDTANRMLENSRTGLMNYIRELKGRRPYKMPGFPREVEAIETATGRVVKVKLGSYEELPDGLEYWY